MATSQNGWPVLTPGDPLLYTWTIPTKRGDVRVRLRNGSAGFLLAHFALWFAEHVEPIAGGVMDDWGHAIRPIRGKTSGYSNHASGTAIDLNATRHPLGKRGTFSLVQQARIRVRLAVYGGALTWGGAWRRPDEMHVEVAKPLITAERLARRMSRWPMGKRILAANPSQRAVIFS